MDDTHITTDDDLDRLDGRIIDRGGGADSILAWFGRRRSIDSGEHSHALRPVVTDLTPLVWSP